MKTKFLQTFFVTVSTLVVAAAAHAQGTVNFNSVTGGQCGITNETTGSFQPIQSGQFLFGLYVGATTNALQNSTLPILVITNAGFPGVISGNNALQVPFLVAGSTYIFQIKGWPVSTGASTYETSFNGSPGAGLGALSQIGQFTIPSNPGGTPPEFVRIHGRRRANSGFHSS